jgi:hypothetical protein
MEIGTVAQHLDGPTPNNFNWEMGNHLTLQEDSQYKGLFKADLFFDGSVCFISGW